VPLAKAVQPYVSKTAFTGLEDTSESSEEECWRKGSRRGGCRRKIVQLSQKLQQTSSHCASISLGASLLQPTL